MSKDKPNPVARATKTVAKHVNVKAANKKLNEILSEVDKKGGK